MFELEIVREIIGPFSTSTFPLGPLIANEMLELFLVHAHAIVRVSTGNEKPYVLL